MKNPQLIGSSMCKAVNFSKCSSEWWHEQEWGHGFMDIVYYVILKTDEKQDPPVLSSQRE